MNSNNGDDILLELHPEALCCKKLILAAIPLVAAAVLPILLLVIIGASLQTILFVGLLNSLPIVPIFLVFRHIVIKTYGQFSYSISNQTIRITSNITHTTISIPRSEIASWGTDRQMNIYLHLIDQSTCCESLSKEPNYALLIVKPKVICIYHWMTNGAALRVISALETKS